MVLVVIGLLVLFMHFLRKYLFKPVGDGGQGSQFQVIRQYHLGPRKNVALVRFAGRLLVLGVTDSNINTLAEIDDPEEVEKIIADAGSSSGAQGGAFRDIYQNLLSRSARKQKQ
jgi:flagellar biosynthetic protein FliO